MPRKSSTRTRAEILEGVEVVRGYVVRPCHNCGGRGTYPSSMAPSGMCRLYCRQDRPEGFYGKEAVPVDRYVARQQAADRREAKRQRAWEAGEAARAAAKRAADDRAANPDPRLEAICAAHGCSVAEVVARATEADEYAPPMRFYEDIVMRWVAKGELTERQWEAVLSTTESVRNANAVKGNSSFVGEVGQRLDFEAGIEGVRHMEGDFGTTSLVRMRDEAGNCFVWFASGYKTYEEGERFKVRATIKKHNVFNEEKQTVISRAVLTACSDLS